MQLEHYINDTRVYPNGWENELGLTIDNSGIYNNLSLNTDVLKFSADDAHIITNYMRINGFSVNIPYQIVFGGIEIDMVLRPTIYYEEDEDSLSISVASKGGAEFIFQKAKGISFELINSKSTITGGFDTPVIVVETNIGAKLSLLLLMELTFLIALYDQIRALANLVSLLLNPFNVVVSIAQVAIQLIHTSAVLLQLIITSKEIYNLILPPVYNYRCNSIKSLITQAIKFIDPNLTFTSTLLNDISNAAIMSAPLLDTNKSIFSELINSNTFFNKDFPSVSDSTPTVYALLEEVALWFNAKFVLSGGDLVLERSDYFKDVASIDFDDVLTDQDARLNSNTYNSDQIWKRRTATYLSDQTDYHTLDRTKGIAYEDSTEPIGDVADSDISGSVELNSRFSLATRKNELNKQEKLMAKVGKAIDFVINLFGGSSNLYGKVNGRIGATMISQPNFANTKIMWVVGDKQPENYLEYIGARAIVTNYHGEKRVRENFAAVQEKEIPFSPSKFLNFVSNRFIYNDNGELVEIMSADWRPEQRLMAVMMEIKRPELMKTKTLSIYG